MAPSVDVVYFTCTLTNEADLVVYIMCPNVTFFAY